ncbi:hypothetical protein CBS101457_005059 [Exobasidium rhododendri]|nr:hypothetical protein CBS101457_005059 [Exobasidium rhododendri]
MVAIDRPGAGGNSSCAGVDRMRISTEQTISVLEALGYGDGKKRINVLTHSAGWFYALELIAQRPDLFSVNTRVTFLSPFIPTHCSGNTILAALPASVVRLAPSANTLLRTCTDGIQWSTGVSQDVGSFISLKGSSTTKEDKVRKEKELVERRRTKERSQVRLPSARFHPPYDSNLELGLEAWKSTPDTAVKVLHPGTGRPLKDGERLLFQYLEIEKTVEAATEDLLFCLGKVEGMSNAAMEKWMEVKLREVASALHIKKGEMQEGSAPRLVIVWGETDFLIPVKGRRYLDALLDRTNVSNETWVMAKGGHDAAIASVQVMDDVLDFLGE